MKKLLSVIAALLALTILSACAHEPVYNQVAVIEASNPSVEIVGTDYDYDYDYNYDLPEPDSCDIDYRLSNRRIAGDLSERPDPLAYGQGLHMQVITDSITPTGLRFSMINDSSQAFDYGYEFRIDKYSQGTWEQAPVITDGLWFMIGFRIAPNTIVDENISWEHMHGSLQPGLYRVVRRFNRTDLYATFVIAEDWQDAHEPWQRAQDEFLATATAIAFARFEGLDLEILEHSAQGLSFTLTNNNPYYSYIINSAFVGWHDIFPGGGHASSIEYMIFSESFPSRSWPFGSDKRLSPGEYLFLEVDWSNQISHRSMRRDSPNPYIFDLTVDVILDVDDEYISEHFCRSHIIPGLHDNREIPDIGHRIRAHFDISP